MHPALGGAVVWGIVSIRWGGGAEQGHVPAHARRPGTASGLIGETLG
jgi:hypothetical protein